MKFYGSVLALCALHSASGFLAAPNSSPAFSRTSVDSSLSSTISGRVDIPEKNRASGQAPSYISALEQNVRTTTAESKGSKTSPAQKIMAASSPVTVQGGSLKTWSFLSPTVEQVQVALKTEGRPLEVDVQLWQGPDNTPEKMRVYVEDGKKRPFHAFIETPRGPNTVSIRNIAQLEFPLTAYVVDAKRVDIDSKAAFATSTLDSSRTIQGGALRTYAFDPVVESVQVMLKTDGRPLNARIELLQGPNNNKQIIELYTEDGRDRPFYAVIETPGSGNVVRVVNTATVEFPLTAYVEPYSVGSSKSLSEPVIGGDTDGFMGQWDNK